ncbi:MAG TPA: PQQ-binding-like beta-propeller repeat protein [Thermomicrobiales bacterium]|nr:PQQ-binding-like beta-propeller repeat protein [Thermomicrobiales bacterium]
MSDELEDQETTPARNVTRRRVLQASAGASLLAGAVALGTRGSGALAQDATPAASPAATPAATGAAALPLVPPEVTTYANDWPVAQGDLASTRVAVGGTIDSTNVAQLGVAWEIPLEASSGFGAITSNPVVQGDVVYIIDNNATVQAVKKETGEVIWKNEYKSNTFGPNGVAIGYGVLALVVGDAAEVVAVKPEDGSELWRTTLTNHNALGITMAPAISQGWVIVSTEPGGNSKGTYEGGANGVVYALDVTNGEIIWSWDTIQDDLWGNFRVNSGGGLWYPPAIDDKGVLYMGIGNPAPWPCNAQYPNASSRPGENDYANNLVALDPTAGQVLWNINIKPRDLYDHDNQQSPVLGTVSIGGVDAEVVFTSGKHGYVAAAHRQSGQEYWRVPVGKHKNDGLLVLPKEYIEIYPGTLGGVESPMAFAEGILYVAALNYPASMNESGFDFLNSKPYSAATSNLLALDGATGRAIWDIELPYGIAGPGPVITKDLLFVGSLDGVVRAFTTKDGKQVWTSQTSAGLNSAFAVAGDMLFVPAGSVIAPSADTPSPAPGYHAAVIAYKIGATGKPTLAPAAAATPEGLLVPAEPTNGEITVTAVDLAFQPKNFSIDANTDVKITLDNKGVLAHDFVIDDPKVDSGMVNGGEQTTFTVNLPAGDYKFYCSVEGHAAAGMVGVLTAK